MTEALDLSRPVTLHLPKRLEVGQGTAGRLGDWANGFERVLVIAITRSAPLVDRLLGNIAEAATGYCRALGLDMSLAAHGISEEALPDWAAEAHGIRRLMDNNPRDMTVGDVLQIYRRAL